MVIGTRCFDGLFERLAENEEVPPYAFADLAGARRHGISELKEYEIKAASEFASKDGLVAAENRFTAAVNSLAARFDAMTTRLDRVLETFVDRRPHRTT